MTDLYTSYLKQAKEETCNRLLKMYSFFKKNKKINKKLKTNLFFFSLFFKGARAPEFKFWIGLSKRKFMGLAYN